MKDELNGQRDKGMKTRGVKKEIWYAWGKSCLA